MDPIPTWLLKLCVNELSLIITQIINLSLNQGCASVSWKSALLRPIFGETRLGGTIRKLHTNLQFVSKIAEKAVVGEHWEEHAPLPVNQSEYRKFHSTEKALVKVQSDILMSMDQREVTLLVLLDLRAAFNTVDHKIMLEVLEFEFGLSEN